MARKVIVVLALVTMVLASAVTVQAADWANPGILLEAKDVKAKLKDPNWVVLDCRPLKYYAKGHIPGAISLGKRCKKALRDGTARAFKNPAKYEKLLGKVGIGNDTHVVIYGEHEKTDTLKDAGVAFWVLEYVGLKGKVHFLNGGIDNWKNAGYSLDNKPTIKPKKTFKAKINYSLIATTDEMIQIAKGQKKGVQVVDARTPKEYKGKDIRAIRGGYIPNTTINVSHKDVFDTKKDLESGKEKDTGFFSPKRVASFYKGLDKNKRTIGYCQTGTRSTLTYLHLRLLGFKDPANYDESWTVYGNRPDTPIANEQYMNFARIRKLEKKLKKLEKSVKALKGE